MLPACSTGCPLARGSGRAAAAARRPLRAQQHHRPASSSHTLEHDISSEPQCSYSTDDSQRQDGRALPALARSLVSRAAGKGKRALRKLKALAELSKQR